MKFKRIKVGIERQKKQDEKKRKKILEDEKTACKERLQEEIEGYKKKIFSQIRELERAEKRVGEIRKQYDARADEASDLERKISILLKRYSKSVG